MYKGGAENITNALIDSMVARQIIAARAFSKQLPG
jgi:hypothetical protein